MEIYAREEGGEEELLRCKSCGAGGLEPQGGAEGTGAPSWSLMSRMRARCPACGEESRFAWSGRVGFRFGRTKG